ncbi:hypothetical protein NHX12_012574, partial [Muraenolepis orangiensis]
MASSETPPPSLRQGVRIAPHDTPEPPAANVAPAPAPEPPAANVAPAPEPPAANVAPAPEPPAANWLRPEPPLTAPAPAPEPPAAKLLQKKRLELSSFLQEIVKGALVRCRFLEIKEMDAPTPFFFNLERSVAQRKQMSCLKLPGGRVTSSPEEMRDHAMDFYTNLFGGEQCSIEGREEILEGLPQLSPEEKAALDLDLTLEELTGAVNQMASGRAPGIDGLSGEFLKHFWGILGADLRGVFSECFRTGSLPVSCRRAVLSLLPKKGDLALLKNWRPVALLTVDYKLYSLAIEPLLCRLRSKLSGLSLPASCGPERPPTLSAYADDVSIFVSSQRDVQCLQDTLSLYERASSAR